MGNVFVKFENSLTFVSCKFSKIFLDRKSFIHLTRFWKYLFVTSLILLTAGADMSFAQSRRGGARRRNAVPASVTDTIPLMQSLTDSLKHSRDSISIMADSVSAAESAAKSDSLSLLEKSSIKRPAFTGAKDTILEVFTDGQRKAYYWGDVTVTYDNIKLTADYMEYDMNTGIVFAKGTYDSLSGEWKGRPVMEQGGQTYSMEEIQYNFNSGKAKIYNMITREDEGILQGRNIKMQPDKSINISNGMYTVCDLEHPHYYLRLSVAKVVPGKSQKTVFGPAWPVFEDVPAPIALPFGFIPQKPSRATGMLMPTFGEEAARGFYIRGAGMYFVIGDYFDLSLTGNIYTLGSWAMDINSRYKVNYKFSGSVSINYSNDQTGERGSTDFFQTRNFGVKWSHSQDSKMHPGTSFSASVNFSSPSNGRYNSTSVQEALQNQISSSISYSRNWNGRFNLSVNALHNQNSRDSSYAFTFPNITFSVSRFYPFKMKNRVGKKKFYEEISFGYTTSLQNKINFKASEFGEPGFVDKFKNGMSHNFQIGLPSFTLLSYLNFTPSVSYGMNWFFRKTEKEFDRETNSVQDIDSGQFGAFGITQTYSGSVSMSTRVYGTYNFGKHRKVQAIRHVITPSVSANFTPELGTYANGWRTLDYIDNSGEAHSLDYNIYSGQLNSVPGKGKNAGLSFSLGNNIEAKVRDFRDTTGAGNKKVKIIDQLNFSGSYNFLADSLNLSNIGVTLSTSVFGKIGLSANANFDPYAINERGVKINRLMLLDNPSRPLRLTNASTSFSYSFSGKGETRGDDGRTSSSPADLYQRIYYHPVTGEYIPGGYLYYTNTQIPWSVNLNYSFNYRRSYSFTNNQLITNNTFLQTLGMSGNLKLTPRMTLNATSGIDIMTMKLTTTQFSATYDLHCFNISVSWVPTGMWKSYSFRIAANASALADLLRFKKSESWWDQ